MTRRGTPPSARFSLFNHADAAASSPPTIASRERNKRMKRTGSSTGLSPGDNVYVPEPIRETVASETPMIRPSTLLEAPRRPAARSTALVVTVPWVTEVGLAPASGERIFLLQDSTTFVSDEELWLQRDELRPWRRRVRSARVPAAGRV